MAERLETFAVTCPAGTAITAPVTTALPFSESIVEKLEITVPNGPSGFMGFRFRHSTQVVIPFDSSKWIVADGVELAWPLQGYPTGDKWSIQMYNTDIFDHTVYVRFLVNEIPSKPLPALTPIAF